MSIVAREVLVERIEVYIDHHPDATVPEILGRFRLDPTADGEHRALVEDLRDGRRDAPSDSGTGDPGGVRA